IDLIDGDVIVVSSKIASKALGLTADTGERDLVIAAQSEWVVAERRVPRHDGPDRMTRVVKSSAGPVMAAAGVDASNTGGRDRLLLLPHDPDDVCRSLHARLVRAHALRRLGVVLSDTAGRAWRVGQTDFALGAHGFLVADDLRGGVDADGRPLEVTTRAVADEVASAADLVKGKTAAVPVAHLRGLADHVVAAPEGAGGAAPGQAGASTTPVPGAASLVRTGRGDWFGLGRAEAVRAALGVRAGSELAARVGIPAVVEESVAVRAARAVGVAIHALDDVGVDLGPRAAGDTTGAQQLVVSAVDPVDVGIATARFLVAAWGEWLDSTIVDRSALSVTLDVTDREGST
ncbi:MAG: coenzyme F420-0:L-glutamate ligase, partial [Lapillicoccus sp.]